MTQDSILEAALRDPQILFFVGAGFICLLLLMGFLSLQSARRSVRAAEPLARQLEGLGQVVRDLGVGQHQLTGGLRHVSETQVAAQSRMMHVIEQRLEEVAKGMGDSLHGASTRTARSLGELQQRLEAIDKAQSNIEKLSGDVLSLQDILSNKQARGAFGEIQLNDIVAKALPPDAYVFQATLGNGNRADCLIRMPNPPGSIVIDAKFPLEAYEALRRAATEPERVKARRQFRTSVNTHLRHIAERYVIEGETADSALMFLPSEAVYAELHANFPEVVRAGFDLRVWIVSPTTMMATLNTMRAILKDARMREQTGAIRRELSQLHKDVNRLGDRVVNLDKHFALAQRDVEQIKISSQKAGNRAQKLEAFEFDDPESAEAEVGIVVETDVETGAGIGGGDARIPKPLTLAEVRALRDDAS